MATRSEQLAVTPRPRDTRWVFAVALATVALLTGVATTALGSPAAFTPITDDAVSGIDASSTADAAAPFHLMDGRAGRAWVSAAGDGDGATLTIKFDRVHWFSHAALVSGHGRDNVSFRSHSRPRALEISWAGRRAYFPLKDGRRPQELGFDSMVVTDTLTITVRGLYGDPAASVALSELTLYEPRDVFVHDPALRERITHTLAIFDDPDMREQALPALDTFGPYATPALLGRVMDQRSPSRAAALEAVLRLDPEAGVRTLKRLVASPDPADITLALHELRDNPRDGFDALLSQLASHRIERVRRAALMAAYPDAHDIAWRSILSERLGDPDEGVRRAAMTAIARVHDRWADAQLLAHVRSAPTPAARRALDLVLSREAPPHAEIGALLTSAHPAQVAAVVDVLADHVDGPVTELVVELFLVERHYSLHMPLNRTLAGHGMPGIVALVERLERRRDVPPVAHDFLVAHAAQAARLAVLMLDDEVSDPLAETLLAVVGAAQAHEARAAALTIFRDRERAERVRRAALASLGHLGQDAEVIDVIVRHLNARNIRLRHTAMQAAQDLQAAAAVPALERRLASTESIHWDPAAVGAYAALGGGDALHKLMKHYDYTNRRARLIILRAAHMAQSRPGITLLMRQMTGHDRLLGRRAEAYLAGRR